MGKLVYGAITSLDGYVEDEHGKFDWAEPKEDVHRFINGLEANNEIQLYGRKMFETMLFWESDENFKDFPDYIQEYGKTWQKARKVVYSRTLKKVDSSNTILKTEFIPKDILTMKKTSQGDISIGGAELAGAAISAGLMDEIYLFIHPIIVGSGKPAIQSESLKSLVFKEKKDFEGGVVMLRYGLRNP